MRIETSKEFQVTKRLTLSTTYIEDTSGNGEELWQNVDRALERGGKVWVLSPLLEGLLDQLGVSIGGKRWLLIEKQPKHKYGLLFRLRDILFSLLVLIFLSPLFISLAILVKATSPGPVFYKGHVIGKGKRRFIWRKFRSMKVVSDKDDFERRYKEFCDYVEGRQNNSSMNTPVKVIDEERVTSIGRILRKYSLDESPQFWNILTGHMSLVGPRPCLPYEAAFFSGWREGRFKVKPGLTGVWQVFGRGRVGFDEAAALDRYYVYRRSFLFDLYLMIKTIGVVLTGEGAR
jgi:undecaprenyl-phosphate galactose phosphotransferase